MLQFGSGIAVTAVPGPNSVFAFRPTFYPDINFFGLDLSAPEWVPRWPYFDDAGTCPSMTSRDGLSSVSCGTSRTPASHTLGRYYPIPMTLGREAGCVNPSARVTEYGFSAAPNPFARGPTIRWQVPRATRALIAVYDAQGRLVKKLYDGRLEPGRYSRAWDTRGMPAGVYLCSFTSSERRMTQRLVLAK